MSYDLDVKFVILGSGFCPNTYSTISGVQPRRLDTANDRVCVLKIVLWLALYLLTQSITFSGFF